MNVHSSSVSARWLAGNSLFAGDCRGGAPRVLRGLGVLRVCSAHRRRTVQRSCVHPGHPRHPRSVHPVPLPDSPGLGPGGFRWWLSQQCLEELFACAVQLCLCLVVLSSLSLPQRNGPAGPKVETDAPTGIQGPDPGCLPLATRVSPPPALNWRRRPDSDPPETSDFDVPSLVRCAELSVSTQWRMLRIFFEAVFPAKKACSP
jgi:hypothetical protein